MNKDYLDPLCVCVFLENFSGEDWDVMQGLHLHFNCRLHPLIQSLCNCTQVYLPNLPTIIVKGRELLFWTAFRDHGVGHIQNSKGSDPTTSFEA